jgi:hypothetical protein
MLRNRPGRSKPLGRKTANARPAPRDAGEDGRPRGDRWPYSLSVAISTGSAPSAGGWAHAVSPS